jgi:hypothetical protein
VTPKRPAIVPVEVWEQAPAPIEGQIRVEDAQTVEVRAGVVGPA